MKKIDILLILTLLFISLFFRLIKFHDFQYWSDDEQLLWFIIRHIVIDQHLSLAVPNVATGIGLGPLYHYLIAPWYWLVNFDPQKILLLGLLFSTSSLISIYILGLNLGGRKVGFLAGFLYSSSFMSSLFDRRLWALSPNIFLVTIGTLALIKIVRGDSRYLYLLIIPVIFTFNSDPSLGVIILSAITTFVIFHPRLVKKHLMISLLSIFLFLSPLVIFELRHQGQNFRSFIQFITQQKELKTQQVITDNILYLQIDNFSRFLFVPQTQISDIYFCYCKLNDKIPFIIKIFIAFCFLIFLNYARKNKQYLILLIPLISYFLGILLFKEIFKGMPAFFYSVTISPLIFIIISIVLAQKKILMILFIPLFFISNLNSLLNSSFKYPLRDKINVVRKTINQLNSRSNFSLYYHTDILIAGGGWTALFVANGYTPNKGNLSLHWGHIYDAYKLYPLNFTNKDPDTVIIISEKIEQQKFKQEITNKINFGQILSTIYNNNEMWFNPYYFSIK